MQKIQLDAYSPLHKTGHTSKGDQLKWKIDNIWYKADYMGYESFSEVLISHLLLLLIAECICHTFIYRGLFCDSQPLFCG